MEPNGKKQEPKRIKKFSISDVERKKIDRIFFLIDNILLQRQGLDYMLSVEYAKIEKRLDIKREDAPKGFERTVRFDDQKYEVIVEDVELPKPAIEIAKK